MSEVTTTARGAGAPAGPVEGASLERPCPACGEQTLELFFQQDAVPVTSNASFRTREEALAVRRGDMHLAFCHGCGMIANVAFEEQPLAGESETSQAASPRFQEYASTLARTWIERYGLRGETVMEIGCARGEFLEVMVDEGAGHGIGVDPVLALGEAPGSRDRLTLVGEYFRADHLHESVRAIICRHTLEHIYDSAAFLGALREAIGDRDIVVLFEVPDAERVLREVAFHDIYYEHCSYFSEGSLRRLFERTGLEVLRLNRTYADQYLVIEARPGSAPTGEPCDAEASRAAPEDDHAALWQAATALRRGFEEHVGRMEHLLRAAAEDGQRVAFWGAGSKATAFLTALSDAEWVDCVVDINPRKWGTYISGTGHAVVAPEHLVEACPDVIVLMNPAYRGEVANMLDALGVSARLIGPDGND
jgi:hypothetical protein